MGATASVAAPPRWQDLPPDVVREISGHLHTTIDFVRFHAVCKPWRNTFDRASRHPPRLLPWLLAPCATADDLADQHCRCVFSGTSYRAPGICVRDRRVACADGTAAWLVRGGDEHGLVNPLTADRLPVSLGDSCNEYKWQDCTHRVVSRDGTVLLYGFAPPMYFRREYSLTVFTLKPGDKYWHHAGLYTGTDRCCAVAYHDNVAVYLTLDCCYIIRPFREAPLPEDPAGKVRFRRYLVEFLGELLLVSVLSEEVWTDGEMTGVLSVSLHALDLKAETEEEAPAAWVTRDVVSLLGDHVLFLGFPSSFAVEATRFSGEVTGGTAYFVVEPGVDGPCDVYMHDFRLGETTVVETLPPEWKNERCMWFLPQPDMAPIETAMHQERAPATSSGTNGGQLRIYVGDLPPDVDNSRLREMFSKYGKVASAKIAYDKRGRSRGFGFVTMATQDGFDNAIAALAVKEPEQGGTACFSKLAVMIVILLLLIFAYYCVFGRC